MKKPFFIVWCCQFVVFVMLAANIIFTFRMMKHYNDGVYNESDVNFLGMIEPYKYHYNKGNIYYKNHEFDKASDEYRKSLDCRIPEGDECSVRINLALSMVTPLDLTDVTDADIDETVKILEDARDVLVEEGCAHMDDEDGHSEDAQTLKDEIDEWLDKLNNTDPENPSQTENQTPESETHSENETQPENETETTESKTSGEQSTEEETTKDSMEEELEQKLKELEQQGIYERGQDLGTFQNYGNYEYYDGDCW